MRQLYKFSGSRDATQNSGGRGRCLDNDRGLLRHGIQSGFELHDNDRLDLCYGNDGLSSGNVGISCDR